MEFKFITVSCDCCGDYVVIGESYYATFTDAFYCGPRGTYCEQYAACEDLAIVGLLK